MATCISTRSTDFYKFIALQTAKASMGDLLARTKRNRMGGAMVKRGTSRLGFGKVPATDLHIDASGPMVGGPSLRRHCVRSVREQLK